MDAIKDFISQPFVWGLSLGLLFAVLSAWGHFKTKREYRRYRRHLSDKLELEARQYELIRKDKEGLAKENENLRLRIGQLNEKPEQKVMRDMEILTRAEKRMMVQAPGFAAAWETAKAAAAEEVTAEDQGRSLPRRLFSRLFGSGTAREALPMEAGQTTVQASVDPSLVSGTAVGESAPAPEKSA
jgi:hypothetical protein